MPQPAFVSNAEVIPSIETDIFIGHENAQFAVGVFAVGDFVLPGRDEEYLGYLRLRANVYADQTQMIPAEHVREDGTEIDGNDNRSLHFGVIENNENGPRVVGAMRLIVKQEIDLRPLPVEEFFPNAFAEAPAPMESTEVSRYICRHENQQIQSKLKWPLYSMALANIIDSGLKPTYAVVEPPLERGLRMIGMPTKRLADPKFLPEYNNGNLALVIDTATFAQNLEARGLSMISEIRKAGVGFVYFDEASQPTTNLPVSASKVAVC